LFVKRGNLFEKASHKEHEGREEHKEKRKVKMNENQIGLIIVDTAINLHKKN